MQPLAPQPASVEPRYQPLVIVLAAACAGIVVDRYSQVAFGSWAIGASAGLAAWWLLRHARRDRGAVVPLLLAAGCVAAAWHHCRWSLFEDDHVGLFAAEVARPVAIEARTIHGPRRIPPTPPDAMRPMAAPERTRLELEVVAVRRDAAWQPASGVVTLTVDGRLVDVRAGDRLRIFGQLTAARQPANPGEFDFAAQARGGRRLCWLRSEFPECVSLLARGTLWNPARLLDFLHARGDGLLMASLGAPRSGLAAAMFLGSREELEPDRAQAFLETGTIHLLVISGLNVGILAGCIFLMMRVGLVRPGWAMALAAGGSVLYAATTDAQPPVVRATVMVLIACMATILGRRALALNSIAAAGLVVLALNPAELFQAGTQLSFLSVVALSWTSGRLAALRSRDPLLRLIARTRPWPQRLARWCGRELLRATVVSAVIWLVVAPLVMARFHLLSPVAIVLGPLLGIPVAVAMAAGFAIFALGWMGASIGDLFGWICDLNLHFVERSVALGRTWHGGHAWVSGPSTWWLCGFYGMLAVWVLAPRFEPPRRWRLATLATWTALGLGTALLPAGDAQRLDCTILSVGHGTAVVVELPGGQTLLYDAGRLGSPASAAQAVAGHLWSRGITHIDGVVLSHADADHYNALPALLERFSVGVVYVSPVMFEHASGSLAALRGAIDRADVPLRETSSGDRLRTAGPATIEVLHPPRRGVLGSDNANSIVLAIEYAGRRILLTGDLEPPGLEEVMAELPHDCDVLLAPHHGSPNSDPPGFAEWSQPEWTVISGSPADDLAEVRAAYSRRGSRVLHTATLGAVQVAIAPRRFAVTTWRAVE